MKVKHKSLDVNKDGYDDRLTLECTEKKGKKEKCSAVQLEMGVSDGSFIAVYDEYRPSEYIPDNAPLYFSPEFYYCKATGGSSCYHYGINPGISIAEKFSDTKPEPLSSDELQDMCIKEEHEMVIEENSNLTIESLCIEQAIHAPLKHSFQPYAFQYWEEIPKDQVRINYDKGIDKRFVVTEDDLALPAHRLYAPTFEKDTDFGQMRLRQNVILDVRARRSNDIRDYLYAYLENEIDGKFFADVLAERWLKTSTSDMRMSISDFMPLMKLDESVQQWLMDHRTVASQLDAEMVLDEIKKDIPVPEDQEGELLEKLEYILAYTHVDAISIVEGLAEEHPHLANKILKHDVPQTAQEFKSRLNSQSNSYEIIVESISKMESQDEYFKNKKIDNLKKSEIGFRLLVDAFAKQHPADFAIWSYSFLDDADPNGFSYSEPATLKAIVANADKVLKDPQNMRPLTVKLLAIAEKYEKKGAPAPDYCRDLVVDIGLMSTTADVQYIPEPPLLMELAAISRDAVGPLAIGIARKGKPSDMVAEWAADMLPKQSKPMAKLILAILSDSEKLTDIVADIDYTDKENRISAYQMIVRFAKPTDAVVDICKQGLYDGSLEIRYMSAMYMIENDVSEVSSILFEQYETYREEEAAKGDMTLEELAKMTFQPTFLKEYKDYWNTRVDGNPDGTPGPTMKQLTLFALSKFGEPKEAAPLLADMLYQEKDMDLMLTAQALVAVGGTNGLKRVIARITSMDSQPAPPELIAYASSAAVETGDETLAPLLYPCLLHYDKGVRQIVANNLKALGNEKTLLAILRDTDPGYKGSSALIRMRLVDALVAFGGESATKRLVELTKDPSAAVRLAASNAICKLKADSEDLLAAQKDPDISPLIDEIAGQCA